MNSPIIIFGMHRSGTTLLSKILIEAGVFLGSSLDENYESHFFNRLNNWMFHQAGATWDNPYNLGFGNSEFIESVGNVVERKLNSIEFIQYLGVKNYLRSDLKKQMLWGWKDPRNIFTWDIWFRVFAKPKVIFIYRHPLDVAESLRNRAIMLSDKRKKLSRTGLKKKFKEIVLSKKRIYEQSLRILDIEEGVKLWIQYLEYFYWKSEKIDYLEVCYEDLLLNKENELKRLFNYLQLPIPEKLIKNINTEIIKERAFAFRKNEELFKLKSEICQHPLIDKLYGKPG